MANEDNRDAIIQLLRSANGFDEATAAHIYDKQIRPRQVAEKHGGETAVVKTGGDIPEGWHEITCHGCGAVAHRPPTTPPPEPGRIVLCPSCTAVLAQGH